MDSRVHGNDVMSGTLKFKTMSTLLITLLLCGLLTWLGLPAMLRALGLHPHYSGPVYALPGKRALIITQTPQHPERELRAAGALFESRQALLDPFANHTVTDGRLVTGQNQTAGVETAHTMLRVAGGLPRP